MIYLHSIKFEKLSLNYISYATEEKHAHWKYLVALLHPNNCPPCYRLYAKYSYMLAILYLGHEGTD